MIPLDEARRELLSKRLGKVPERIESEIQISECQDFQVRGNGNRPGFPKYREPYLNFCS